MEFQRVTRDLEHCKKVYVAWKFINALQSSEKANEDVQKMKQKITDKQQSIQDGEQESKNIDEKIVNITNKKNAVGSSIMSSS